MTQPNIRLISGTNHPQLSKDVSTALKIPLTPIRIERFSDGEIYVKVQESGRGDDFFVIQPTANTVNDSLMELLLIIDALKRASVHSVTAVIPYYGYARQDRKASSREPISAKLVANLLTAAGVDRVLAVDLHTSQIQGFFDIPVDNLMPLPLLAKYFLKKKLKDVVVVSPDAGSIRRARMGAKLLNAPLAIVDKRREKHNEAEAMHIIGDVKDKTCILIDDMIDTGGTIIKAVEALHKQGAIEVYVAATHGVFSSDAIERLKQSEAREIVITDTIAHKTLPKKFTLVPIGAMLGEAIRRIHENKSMGDLFDELQTTEPKRLQE
jgi:ribose-phosphate pyrophosphokinase